MSKFESLDTAHLRPYRYWRCWHFSDHSYYIMQSFRLWRIFVYPVTISLRAKTITSFQLLSYTERPVTPTRLYHPLLADNTLPIPPRGRPLAPLLSVYLYHSCSFTLGIYRWFSNLNRRPLCLHRLRRRFSFRPTEVVATLAARLDFVASYYHTTFSSSSPSFGRSNLQVFTAFLSLQPASCRTNYIFMAPRHTGHRSQRPAETIQSIGIQSRPMDIHGVPPHIFNEFGVLP